MFTFYLSILVYHIFPKNLFIAAGLLLCAFIHFHVSAIYGYEGKTFK